MRILPVCIAVMIWSGLQAQGDTSLYQEHYRPQVHFSPKAHWMNDPNGTVYFQGKYHLFFQYYPGGMTWGPMHWGHAESQDLWHWRELPVALYPDSLGYIFSGCVVVDSANTSGLGKGGKVPLVAFYTNHDVKGEQEHRQDFQTQRIAYSLDGGYTWAKLDGPPVIDNPGIRDFRDPAVCWFAPGKRWVLTLATSDRMTFYSSPDLLHWTRESDFGSRVGAHGGVWECPDLFPLPLKGGNKWILLSSINPGGPAGGSATQYFIGDFDGHRFSADDTLTRWLDYGPDNYAGRMFSNTGVPKLFIGWMSNWNYGQQVPTTPWRSANTIVRKLEIFRSAGGQLLVSSRPISFAGLLHSGRLGRGQFSAPSVMELSFNSGESGSAVFLNNEGDSTVIGYDAVANQYYLNRKGAGDTRFSDVFAGRYVVPRFTDNPVVTMTIVADKGSFELFADEGKSVLTALVFPHKPYDRLLLKGEAGKGAKASRVTVQQLVSTWKP